MSNNSVTNRLLIHLMSRHVKNFQSGLQLIRQYPENARKAKQELEQFRQAMRSASDADPNWTDTQIDEMILEALNKQLKIQGRKPID